jgi:hypothetical protein
VQRDNATEPHLLPLLPFSPELANRPSDLRRAPSFAKALFWLEPTGQDNVPRCQFSPEEGLGKVGSSPALSAARSQCAPRPPGSSAPQQPGIAGGEKSFPMPPLPPSTHTHTPCLFCMESPMKYTGGGGAKWANWPRRATCSCTVATTSKSVRAAWMGTTVSAPSAAFVVHVQRLVSPAMNRRNTDWLSTSEHCAELVQTAGQAQASDRDSRSKHGAKSRNSEPSETHLTMTRSTASSAEPGAISTTCRGTWTRVTLG